VQPRAWLSRYQAVEWLCAAGLGAAGRQHEMLVVTSNWSIPDGTLYRPLPMGRADHFLSAVQRAALRFGFRRDGTYRPITQIDLVLAGDTSDWLVSREWTQKVRPWQGGSRTTEIFQRVASSSLRSGARFFARLSRLVRRGIALPKPDKRSRPDPRASQPTPVRVTLLSGDRDRWLGHPMVAPLAVGHCLAIGTSWSSRSVIVCHGDTADPLLGGSHCQPSQERFGDATALTSDRQPTLAESLAVDLLARFGVAIFEQRDLQIRLAALLRRMATGWPLDMPGQLAAWLTAPGTGELLDSGAKKFVLDTWQRAVGHWHREARRVDPCGDLECDSLDRLADWMSCIEGPKTTEFSVSRLHELLDPNVFPLTDRCVPENQHAEANRPLRTVVLGHPPAERSLSAMVGQRSTVCLGGPRLPFSTESLALHRTDGVAVSCVVPSGERIHCDQPAAIALLDSDAEKDGYGGVDFIS